MTKNSHRFNPALIALLGLCPLLPASNDVYSGFLLACATVLIGMLSGSAALLLRCIVSDTLRWPVAALLIAIATSIVALCARAFAYDSFRAIASWLPLIASNCVLLACIDSRAPTFSLRAVAIASLAMALLLIGVGGLRQALPADSLGALALIAAGLLLAAKNYFSPKPDAPDGGDGQPPSSNHRRVRVTGPVR